MKDQGREGGAGGDNSSGSRRAVIGSIPFNREQSDGSGRPLSGGDLVDSSASFTNNRLGGDDPSMNRAISSTRPNSNSRPNSGSSSIMKSSSSPSVGGSAKNQIIHRLMRISFAVSILWLSIVASDLVIFFNYLLYNNAAHVPMGICWLRTIMLR